MKRKHIPLKQKYAATLYDCWRISHILVPGQPGSQIDEFNKLVEACRDARKSADELISLFAVDHNEYHCHDGSDEWWNLTPMPKWAHVEKTRQDLAIIAKGKRLQRKEARHKAALGNKEVAGHLTAFLDQAKGGKIHATAVLGLPPLKRKWPSRPFPNRKRNDPA